MRITVLGLGHLGMVAASGLAMAGHEVTGIDINDRTIEKLRAGEAPIYEPGLDEWVASGVDRGSLRFFHLDEFDGRLGDVVLIATGTPAAESGEADLRQVRSALAWIKSFRPRNLVLVMKSTVPPGTGLAVLRQDLKGMDVDYVANPEFLREGRALEDWKSPGRIVVGADAGSGEAVAVVKKMYSGITAPYLVTDITSAEMIKYANNAFLATRVSFINEIASLCDQVGASIDAVSKGLAMDARTGDRIHAGVGYGGSCFPKDVRALDYLALTSGFKLDLLRSVITINKRQRLLPLDRLQDRFPGAMTGLNVGVLGLAFKLGTNDVRDAPSLDVINALVEEGARVRAFDPQANGPARELLPPSVAFVDRPEETARGAEALILLTEWAEIVEADWAAIASDMCPPRFVFDGRNALDAELMARLGFEYNGVGRGRVDTGAVRSRAHLESRSAPVTKMANRRQRPRLTRGARQPASRTG